MDDLNVYFSETTSVKRLCLLVHRDWIKGCIFRDRRERKMTQTYGNGDDVWGFLNSRKKFLKPFLSRETNWVFMVTCYFCELQGENGIDNIAN